MRGEKNVFLKELAFGTSFLTEAHEQTPNMLEVGAEKASIMLTWRCVPSCEDAHSTTPGSLTFCLTHNLFVATTVLSRYWMFCSPFRL